jgi:hypothetical protein
MRQHELLLLARQSYGEFLSLHGVFVAERTMEALLPCCGKAGGTVVVLAAACPSVAARTRLERMSELLVRLPAVRAQHSERVWLRYAARTLVLIDVLFLEAFEALE